MAKFPTKNLIKPVVVSVADEQAAQALLDALPDSEWLAMMRLCIREAIRLGALHRTSVISYIRPRHSEPYEDDEDDD
jgi:hypothetical protein